jgi:hypothetical protein
VRNHIENFGEEICKIRVSNIACQYELAYEWCNRIRRVEIEASSVAQRKIALYTIAAKNETAKNERLCEAAEVSTGQGDVLQDRIIIVPTILSIWDKSSVGRCRWVVTVVVIVQVPSWSRDRASERVPDNLNTYVYVGGPLTTTTNPS